jgi:glycerol-3-phosphate dehydrogenase
VSVVGGKYTTFRAMAEEITDVLAQRLGKKDRCRTGRLRLHGAPAQPWPEFASCQVARIQKSLGLSATIARRLVERYGTDLEAVMVYLQSPAARLPIVAQEPELRGEFHYQHHHEMALRPDDHSYRRSRLALYRSDLASSAPC